MVILTLSSKTNGKTFYFDEQIQNVNFIKLHSCSLYNSWNNLSTWGKIRAVPDADKQYNLLSVPSGHHTLETLAQYFNQDKKVAEGAAYTINGGLYFTSKKDKVQFIDGFAGLFRSLYTPDQKNWFFHGLKINTYFIYCNLVDQNENYFNTTKSKLLAKFDVKGRPYEKVLYQADNDEPFRKCYDMTYFNSITVSVKDEYDNLFDFNNMPLDFVLEVK